MLVKPNMYNFFGEILHGAKCHKLFPHFVPSTKCANAYSAIRLISGVNLRKNISFMARLQNINIRPSTLTTDSHATPDTAFAFKSTWKYSIYRKTLKYGETFFSRFFFLNKRRIKAKLNESIDEFKIFFHRVASGEVFFNEIFLETN